jgi:uncharacterized protein (UPF0264 family)
MRLLVSVADGVEARTALAGGADLIDAKDPGAGALGAVPLDRLRDIRLAVGQARPLTAAIGDIEAPHAAERAACAYASAGAIFVKIGFGGVADTGAIASVIAAAVRGAARGSGGRCGVTAVAYAGADRGGSIDPFAFIDAAARAGAAGVLLDTADKEAPGLLDSTTPDALAAWTDRAHRRGLSVALAGRLTLAHLPIVHGLGVDIAGVRGAACRGGRNGRIDRGLVRRLRTACATGSLDPEHTAGRRSPPMVFRGVRL